MIELMMSLIFVCGLLNGVGHLGNRSRVVCQMSGDIPLGQSQWKLKISMAVNLQFAHAEAGALHMAHEQRLDPPNSKTQM